MLHQHHQRTRYKKWRNTEFKFAHFTTTLYLTTTYARAWTAEPKWRQNRYRNVNTKGYVEFLPRTTTWKCRLVFLGALVQWSQGELRCRDEGENPARQSNMRRSRTKFDSRRRNLSDSWTEWRHRRRNSVQDFEGEVCSDLRIGRLPFEMSKCRTLCRIGRDKGDLALPRTAESSEVCDYILPGVYKLPGSGTRLR